MKSRALGGVAGVGEGFFAKMLFIYIPFYISSFVSLADVAKMYVKEEIYTYIRTYVHTYILPWTFN